MSDQAFDGFAIPLALPSEHGLLHGRLAQVEAAAGLVILAHDCAGQDARNEAFAGRFRLAGLSTLSLDLLAGREAHFADVRNNVPLLVKRLLDFIGLIKKRMLIGELPPLPIGLWAADAAAPAAVRVAALRDHDIAAVVCQGGLIDLAGMLYLRTLASPLLALVEDSDVRQVVSNRRALQEVRCCAQLRLLPEIGIDFAASAGFAIAAGDAAKWFVEHLAAAPAAANAGPPDL